MFARIACIALLAAALLAAAPAAAMKDEDGLTGLWGICWGMSVADAIALFGRSEQVQRTKISVSGCYVRYAILIRLLNEDWSIWLCEAPDAAVVAALNFESKSGHTRHFDSFLEAFTGAFGPAHSYWHTCHNANWNKTVQYEWYFPEMRVSLVDRNEPANWVVMHYVPPSDRVEYGPGVCIESPLDLRRDAVPERE